LNSADEIRATLEEYANAYCAKDLARLMAIFVDGEAISLIGTGSDELCSGRAAIASVFERNFADATATQFEWGWTDIVIHGQAATVAIALKIHLKLDAKNVVIPLRWTVSLIKINDLWKWVHRHASAVAISQEKGTAYPTGET
jgi:ketosteroid isomerase-like protein